MKYKKKKKKLKIKFKNKKKKKKKKNNVIVGLWSTCYLWKAKEGLIKS